MHRKSRSTICFAVIKQKRYWMIKKKELVGFSLNPKASFEHDVVLALEPSPKYDAIIQYQ